MSATTRWVVGVTLAVALVIGAIFLFSQKARDAFKSLFSGAAKAKAGADKVAEGAGEQLNALGELLAWMAPTKWRDALARGNAGLRDRLIGLTDRLHKVAQQYGLSAPLIQPGDRGSVGPDDFAIYDLPAPEIGDAQSVPSRLNELLAASRVASRYNVPVSGVMVYGRSIWFVGPTGRSRVLIVPTSISEQWGAILSDDAACVDDNGDIIKEFGFRNPPKRLAQLLRAFARVAGVADPGIPTLRVPSWEYASAAAPNWVMRDTFITGFLTVPPGDWGAYARYANPIDLTTPGLDIPQKWYSRGMKFNTVNFNMAGDPGRGKWSE